MKHTTVITTIQNKDLKSKILLELSAKIWFAAATIGQWIFGIYVFGFYHRSAFSGDFEKWNRVLPAGYIPGDSAGNISVAVHVLLGGIIIVGGPLQFLPMIQKKYKLFHKWLGRIYVVTVMLIGLAGLLMVWIRGAVGDLFMHISISISAIYLITFAVLTIKNAMARNIKVHRKMALRLFMIANGGWFFRIGLMAWIVVNKGPAGFNTETFSGPALWIISAFSYSLPLALFILELYFYAQEKKNQTLNIVATAIICFSTLLTILGITAAALISWIPRTTM